MSRYSDSCETPKTTRDLKKKKRKINNKKNKKHQALELNLWSRFDTP